MKNIRLACIALAAAWVGAAFVSLEPNPFAWIAPGRMIFLASAMSLFCFMKAFEAKQ